METTLEIFNDLFDCGAIKNGQYWITAKNLTFTYIININYILTNFTELYNKLLKINALNCTITISMFDCEALDEALEAYYNLVQTINKCPISISMTHNEIDAVFEDFIFYKRNNKCHYRLNILNCDYIHYKTKDYEKMCKLIDFIKLNLL